MDKNDFEKEKAKLILGQMGQMPPVGQVPMASPPIGMQMKMAPPGGGGAPPMGGPAKPPMGGPPGAPPGPPGPEWANPTGGAPKPPPSALTDAQPPKPAGAPETKREQEVRRSIENLRGVIMEIMHTVYQMPMTEEQVRDLAFKILQTISERANEVTVGRVVEITHDLIGGMESSRTTKGKR